MVFQPFIRARNSEGVGPQLRRKRDPPVARELDEKEEFSYDTLRKMAELGLFGVLCRRPTAARPWTTSHTSSPWRRSPAWTAPTRRPWQPRTLARDRPALLLRQRGAEAALPAQALQGRNSLGVVSRENAAVLYEQLKARGDFREHSTPQTQVQNGQSQTLARTQPRTYSRSVQVKNAFPFYDLIPGKVDEGYSLTISPLMSLDGKSVEAAIECQVDQVEKLLPVSIDIPIGKQSTRAQVQVPQMVSWRLSERFRWPADQVLLLSCGVVANPAGAAGPLAPLLSPIGGATSRADALLLVEHRGAASDSGSSNGVAAASPAPAPVTAVTPAPMKSAVVPASAISPFRRY